MTGSEIGSGAYFEAPPAPDGTRPSRRILLLSWHFPPGQGAGALRWQQLATHAAERGFGLDAVAAHPSELTRTDPDRLQRLPPGSRVFTARRPELLVDRLERHLHGAYDRLGRDGKDEGGAAPDANGGSRDLRPGRTSWPRAEIGWEAAHPLRTARRAYFAARQVAEHGAWARRAAEIGVAATGPEHAVVVGCGPPHLTHEGARRAAARLGLPLVMDMRDPWSLQERLAEHVASPLWYALARRYERRCVEAAALVVCNTPTAAEAMRDAYPDHAGKVVAVLNGFDEEPLPSTPERTRFLVAYAGSIYLDRDPRPLFRAASRVIRKLDLGPDRFGLGFLGNVDDYGGVPLATMAEQEGIGPFVETGGFRPRREAMEYLTGASLLVSLPQDSDLAIPSKVYEYLRFPAWVLAMAGPGSATERVLRDTEAHVVPRDDVEGLARVLRARYEAFSRGERPSPIAESHPELSRREQARVLFDALEARLNTDSPATPGRDR